MDTYSHTPLVQLSLPAFIVLLCLWIGCRTAQGEELSFKTAFDRMCTANLSLKAARARVEKSEYEQSATQGLYFPEIWIEASHTRMNDDIGIDLNDIRSVIGTLHGMDPAMLPSFELDVQTADFSNADIRLSWMIYTGGKIQAANRAAVFRVADTREQLLYKQSILTTELAKRYYGYILSMEAENVHLQLLKDMEKHLDQAKKLEENGMLSHAERLHAQVAYADASRQYKRSQRSTRIALAGLNNTLSRNGPITPVSRLFLIQKIAPLETYMARAEKYNHMLKQIAAQKKMTIENYNIQKAEHLPAIYFFGNYELYQADLTVLEPDWAAGIGATFSLFEGFSDTNKIKMAIKQKQNVAYIEQKARQDIKTLVEKKHHELMMEIEQVNALKASMAFARENVRVRERAFQAGMAASLNVVDARLALSKVNIETLNALYGFDVALAQLLEICGLSEEYAGYQDRSDLEVAY